MNKPVVQLVIDDLRKLQAAEARDYSYLSTDPYAVYVVQDHEDGTADLVSVLVVKPNHWLRISSEPAK